MKVIISGSREGFNKEEFFDYMKLLVQTWIVHTVPIFDEVVSGTARGIDSLGEEWAMSFGIPIKKFPADWNKHGKSAGFKRNEEMAKYADCLIAFWDGGSRGTKHMIDLALKHGLKLFVFTKLEKNDSGDEKI
jgi:hypothetical protein